MKKTPYIGVTGFMARNQIERILQNPNMQPSLVGRFLMIGVLVSSKTLQGLQNKWPLRYPKIEDISSIFVDHPSCLNLIHFSSDNPENLFEDLMKITKLAGPYLHGFQLNIPWPDKDQLVRYKTLYPDMEIVLQVGERSFLEKNNDLTQVYRAVCGYKDIADHLLLDMSAGKGTPLDPENIKSLVSEFSPLGYFGIGVAGGLSAKNMQTLLLGIVELFPDISIDAEGKLQATNGGLDLNEVRKYLESSVTLFQGLKV